MSSLVQSSGLTGFVLPNGIITASVSGNALTVSIKNKNGNSPSPTEAIFVAFQKTIGSGSQYEGKYITAPLGITISSGSTMGFAAATCGRLWLLLFLDGDNFYLGLRNCTDPGNLISYPLAEFGTDTPLYEDGSGGSDNFGATYVNVDFGLAPAKPFRILGFVSWSFMQAAGSVPGTWDVAPDVLQILGPGIHKPGEVVQSKPNLVKAASSGTGVIPYDDTIPQKTEGDTVISSSLSGVIAPADIIEHEILLNFSNATGADKAIASLFRGTASDALAVAYTNVVSDCPAQIKLSHRHLHNQGSGSYTVKLGTAGGGTLTLNGSAGSRLFGGAMSSSHVIREIMG